MIDPSKITNYNLNKDELEEVLLFWVCAAGKNGTTAARLVDELLEKVDGFNKGPFNSIKTLDKDELVNILKSVGIGCYNHKARTMLELTNSKLNLKTCTAEELESIYGIGMKTSRCFIIHSRQDAQYAGLDTHMLKHLREEGIKDVPKSTPTSRKQYERLEKEVLKLVNSAGVGPSEYDLKVWNKYAIKGKDK